MKAIKDLLFGCRILRVVGNTEDQVSGVHYDSRSIAPDYLFVAIVGTQVDGHHYIDQAIASGAKAVVCEKLPEVLHDGITYIQTKDSAYALSAIAAHWYDHPSQGLKVVGVTGTNGKTSVATLLHQLFTRAEGECAGLLSTIKIVHGTRELASSHTTPDALSVQKHMREMVDAGLRYCFMEVSSHALVQRRVSHVHFDVAIFTNITRDHLDYHGDMNAYIKAKKMLFDQLDEGAVALTNDDHKHGGSMVADTKAKVRTYALKFPADYKVKILERQLDGMLLTFNDKECWTRILGTFNAYNLCAVYGTAIELGLDEMEVLVGMSQLEPAAGRFQTLTGKGIMAVVDYAHTPDALENVLQTLQELSGGAQQIITVVGAGGNRDQGKRPLMAEVAVRKSDKVVLTSDNPRMEDPNAILAQMEAGVPVESRQRVLTIADRAQAIRTALMLAQSGDYVLIAGKGHENYQDINGTKHHFSDVEQVQQFFNS